MQDTLINFLAVVIVGNLALMGAWVMGGIIWFAIGDYIKGRC